MADKSWKQFERRVADYFHGRRNPLSGCHSGHGTRADVIHETLFFECKQRVKHSAVTLWDDTKKKAVKEGKTPVVCLSEKNRPGFWIVVHSDDFLKL